MNILVIDDEMLSLGLLTDLVAREMPEEKIFPFTSPVDAIEFAKESPCSAVFLDIHMREMNGIQTAKVLRESNPDIKIIFVSSDPQLQDMVTDIPDNSYFVKPITSANIATVVNKYELLSAS